MKNLKIFTFFALLAIGSFAFGETNTNRVGISYGMVPYNSTYSKESFKINSGDFIVEYDRQLFPFMRLGGVFSACHGWKTEKAISDNSLIFAVKTDLIWFSFSGHDLYSSFAAGLDWRIQESRRGYLSTFYLSPQITPIGLTKQFNEHYYLRTELGFGGFGILRIGFGYCF